jgi:hypothetical protein
MPSGPNIGIFLPMRLWTIHPSYLDAKGLVAAWREGLLAQKVLEGGTAGYANHPQLIRFKLSLDSSRSISEYLHALYLESEVREYRFDRSKIHNPQKGAFERMGVNRGQIVYEFELLKWKLETRDRAGFERLRVERKIMVNPAFAEREGGIEAWEKAMDLPPHAMS